MDSQDIDDIDGLENGWLENSNGRQIECERTMHDPDTHPLS